MKPSKNHVMCPECFKPKMVFETEKQALNFIKFNKKDVERDGETLRAYYCPSCMGWHITSKPYRTWYKGQTDRLIKAYEFSRHARNMFRKSNLCMFIIRLLSGKIKS
jgi:hypothetical protein